MPWRIANLAPARMCLSGRLEDLAPARLEDLALARLALTLVILHIIVLS
jgi:hypothetical protein